MKEASDFDLLLRDRTISLADAGQGSVAQFKLSSSGFTPIGPVLQLKRDLVTALAVDWVTRNLYWTSVKSPQLYVTSPGGKFTVLVLQAELEGTLSIALHPPTGRLCFTAVGRGGPSPCLRSTALTWTGGTAHCCGAKPRCPLHSPFLRREHQCIGQILVR